MRMAIQVSLTMRLKELASCITAAQLWFPPAFMVGFLSRARTLRRAGKQTPVQEKVGYRKLSRRCVYIRYTGTADLSNC